jgi:DNA-binding response OmpR family regulator
MAKSKILVIDDEPSIQNVVTAYLRAEGYEYNTADDGPSGLKAFRAFKPDLVVLDIMLPGMDGIEVLSQIRRESDV